jgi:hypothetical protein
MASPTLLSAEPSSGPSGGRNLVRLLGREFAERVEVRFGAGLAEVRAVGRLSDGTAFADVLAPPGSVGIVHVTVANLDAAGRPVPAETATLAIAYRYLRADSATESDLTRVVRQVLRELKLQVLPNVSMTVSLDYDPEPFDGIRVIAPATLPSLVLSGPTVRESRPYATNVCREALLVTSQGAELIRHRPPLTVDLGFTLMGTTERTVELMNLLAAVATFLHRNTTLEVLRDASRPELGSVRYDLDPEPEMRSELRSGNTDLRVFTASFAVRGFDIDEGLPLERGFGVLTADVRGQLFSGGVDASSR